MARIDASAHVRGSAKVKASAGKKMQVGATVKRKPRRFVISGDAKVGRPS